MANGNRVEGITSEEIARLRDEVETHRTSALTAIIDFYVCDDDESRQLADERARAAYQQMASAEAKIQGLRELQTDAQVARQQIADWVKIVSDASMDERR